MTRTLHLTLILAGALRTSGAAFALGPYGGANLPSVPLSPPIGCFWSGDHISRPDCVDPAGPPTKSQAESAIKFEETDKQRRAELVPLGGSRFHLRPGKRPP